MDCPEVDVGAGADELVYLNFKSAAESEDEANIVFGNTANDEAAKEGRLLHGLPPGLIAEKPRLHAAVKRQVQWLQYYY